MQSISIRSSFTVVLGSLVAGMVGAFVALSVSGTPAIATRMVSSDLGPADALILSGSDGAVTVTNQGGRMSWAESPTSRAYSIGCVFIDPVMKGILSSGRFSDVRQKFDDEARIQGEEFERRSKSLQEKYPDLKPEDPNFEIARRDFKALQVEYEQWLAALQKIQSKHMAEQVQNAYREMIAALEIVADRKKIDFIYRFVPPDRPFESVDLSDAMMQVQGRPFLRYPAATDITEELSKELGLSSNP